MKVSDDTLIAAFEEYESNRRVASAVGLNIRTVERRRKSLALKGWSPEHDYTRPVPDGFTVGGVSSLYNKHGELVLQWVKSRQDAAEVQKMLDAAIGAFTTELPKLPRRKVVGKFMPDLMACYPIGDAHLGMRAWAEECGADWDLAIAERTQCGAMDRLVQSAPAAKRAVVIDLGDWLHYDSMAAVTPRGGHHLDADGRYGKLVQVGIKVFRQCIESALTKHAEVDVFAIPGNHNETGALFMAAALAHIYEKEPRVRVHTSPALFQYLEFGKVLVGLHHGHTCKPNNLPGVMAADRAEAWGRTKHRYWWLGHVHHQSVKEYPGVTVETFNTLAANDAYATAGGWRSRENMKCIVLHKEHGEVARHTVNPAMLEAA